jgi:hypothetical protein
MLSFKDLGNERHFYRRRLSGMTEQNTTNTNTQGDQEQAAQEALRPNTTNTNPQPSSGRNTGRGAIETNDTRTGLNTAPAPGVNSGTNTTEGINLGYGDTVKTIEEELKEYNPNWKPDQKQGQSQSSGDNSTDAQAEIHTDKG